MDAREYVHKHIDELRAIQSNIDIDADDGTGRFQSKKSRLEERRAAVEPLVRVMMSFIRKGYSVKDISAIIEALGLEIGSTYVKLVKEGVSAALKKQRQEKREQQANFKKNALAKRNEAFTKRQETNMYPKRFTSSKPTPPKDMTSSVRAKLNLRHIQQVDQPASVSPSENTRKAKLSVSSLESHSIPKQSAHKKAHGQIEGLEEDGRLFNSEKDMYLRALDKVGNNLQQPNPRIHATNDVRAAVRHLPNGSQLANRLRAWR